MWMELDHVSQLLSRSFPCHRSRASVQQDEQTLKPEMQGEELDMAQLRKCKWCKNYKVSVVFEHLMWSKHHSYVLSVK